MAHGSALMDLKLLRANGKRSANQLRIFLIDVAACRQTMTLRSGRLTWEDVGVQSPVAMNSELACWQNLLQKHSYVLAMTDFANHGDLLDLRLQLCEKKPPGWAPYIAAMSGDALKLALEAGGPDRLADLVRACRSKKVEFWNKRFVYGAAQENMVANNVTDGLLGYGVGSVPLQGRSKMEVHDSFMKLKGVGRFYSQHGMMLLCRGGLSSNLSSRKVTGVQDSVVVGDGACRIIGLLKSENGCPPDVRWSSANLSWFLEAIRSERETMAYLAEKRFAKHPHMIPLPLHRTRKSGQWVYTFILECMGDFLCESAQVLNALMHQSHRQHRSKLWSDPQPWPFSEDSEDLKRCAKRRRVQKA